MILYALIILEQSLLYLHHKNKKIKINKGIKTMDQPALNPSHLSDLLLTHTPEELAYLLIQQCHDKESFSLHQWSLLNALIENEEVPEETAQQLLCIKIMFLMGKDSFNSLDVALTLLDKLSDPNYRLTCLTNTYFQLVSLKANILILQNQYQSAFEYVKGIYELNETDSEFNELENAEKIKNEFKIIMAISAHFAKIEDNLSYNLFSEILFKDNSFSQLSFSNCNVFIIFGYECFRVQKHEQAALIFDQVDRFIKKNKYAFSQKTETKDLEQEAMAMRLISKKAAHQTVSKQEIKEFCEIFAEVNKLSDKNKKLRTHVVELLQQETLSQPLTMMYQSAKKNQGVQLNGVSNICDNRVPSKNNSPKYG